MAPTHSKPNLNKPRIQCKLVAPSIGLPRAEEKKDYAKGEYTTVKLRNIPNDPNSMTYDYQIPFFKSGTPEERLIFKARFERVLTGQYRTTAVQRYARARRFLQGQALSLFDTQVDAQPQVNLANHDQIMTHVNNAMFPQKAYITQTCWKRKYLKKSCDMKTPDYVTRVQELNRYSIKFLAPTNNQTDNLDDDKIMDILEYGMSPNWRSVMLVQGFNFSEKTPVEFIEFCERLEMTEPHTDISDEKIPKKEKSSGSGNDKEKQKNNRKHDDGKEAVKGDCILYGENCGHTSHNYCTLKRLAKKTKDSWDKKKPKKKEELHTMLAESFATAMKNMMKKKKEFSKSKAEFDLNMLDGLSIFDDEKSNAKMEDGEICSKDNSSASLWKQVKPKLIAAVGAGLVIKRAASLNITFNNYLGLHCLMCLIN